MHNNNNNVMFVICFNGQKTKTKESRVHKKWHDLRDTSTR